MSLLTEIYKAKSKTPNRMGWVDFDNWNLATIAFPNHEDAEHAYEILKPIYDDIVSNQTWDALREKGITPDAPSVSFRHHLWVDENNDEFLLCVSFDNQKQTDDFIKKAKNIIETPFQKDFFTILQSESDAINRHMTQAYGKAIQTKPNTLTV